MVSEKKKQAEKIRVTIEVEFARTEGNMFESPGSAEQAIGNYLHDWLSDNVEIESFDCVADDG